MEIVEKIRGLFHNDSKVIADDRIDNILGLEEIGDLLRPVFNEIPPESKVGEYMKEGLQSWTFIAISAIADAISTNEYELYRRQGDIWIETEDHAFLKLWERPNPVQTREEFNWLLTTLYLAAGEVPILLDKAVNPTSMIILNPERLTVKYEEGKIIGGYSYVQSNGQKINYEAEQVIMLKSPNVASPFRGRSILKYISKTIDLDNFIESYMNLFFYNSAMPSGVIETPQQLNNDVIKRLRAQFEARHRGVKKAHKISVLELGMKFNNTTFKISELQAVELQNAIRDKVFATFRVPKSVVGIVEDVNRANAEASMITFGRNAVLPKLKMIEGQINQFLLPKFTDGMNIWFEFENPVPEDKQAEASYYVMLVNSGILTANEVREELGKAPLPELPPVAPELPETESDVPAKMLAKSKVLNKRRGVIKADKVEATKKEITTRIEKASVDFIKQFFPAVKKQFTEEERKAYHQEKIVFSDQLEAELKKKLAVYFKKMKGRVLDQIKSKKVIKVQTPQLNVDEELGMFIKVISPYYKKSIELQSALTYWLLGDKDKLPAQDEIVLDFIKENSNKVGKGVILTSNDAIKRIVEQWAEEGGDLTQLRGLVSDYFDAAEVTRAENIARTEISRANGFATEEVYKRMEVAGKEWVTADDELTCPFCAEMNGVVIPIGNSFWEQGDSMEVVDTNGNLKTMDFGFGSVDEYPLHPNCRCDLFPVYNEVDIPADPFGYKINDMAVKAKAINERQKQYEEKMIAVAEKELELNEKEKELEQNITDFETLRKWGKQ